jgi:hypothetical protein
VAALFAFFAATEVTGAQQATPRCDCRAERCLDLVDAKSLQAVEGRVTVAAGSYVLRLAQPVCAKGSGSGKDEFGAERDWPGEVALHIAPSEKVAAVLGRAVGARVRLDGHPFPAHTAWHQTNIVFDAVNIMILEP